MRVVFPHFKYVVRAACALACVATGAVAAGADELGEKLAAAHARVAPALRVVRVGLETEDGKRAELHLAGVVVSPGGMTLVPMPQAVLTYPRSYFRRIELIRPSQVDEPIDARLVSVNDLLNVAFVEPAGATSRSSAAAGASFVDFAAAADPPSLGGELISLGLLDESAGYRCSFQVVRTGPAVGDEQFVVSGAGQNELGPLLLLTDGRPVGLRRDGDEELFLRRSEGFAAGFITQPRAVRASVLRPAIEWALTERRDRPTPWMGVAGLSVASRDVCEAYGLPADTLAIVVGAVVEGFPAARAGLRPKDFIIRSDGRALVRGRTDEETLDLWTRAIKRKEVGAPVALGVWRDGAEESLVLHLAEAPISEAKAEREFSRELGLSVREIVFQDRFDRRLEAGQAGVVVANLVQSGPAETADLEEGDIIHKIDETAIADLAGYRRVVHEKLEGRPRELVFSVLRGTSEQLIARVELQSPRAERSAPEAP